MPTIALLSPCGHGNLGDAAIQDSAIAGFRARIPDVRFVGITLVPADTVRRHGIPAFPLAGRYHPKYPVVLGSPGFATLQPDTESAADVPPDEQPDGSAGPGQAGSGARPSGQRRPALVRALLRLVRKLPGFRYLRSLRDELAHIAAGRRLLRDVDLLAVSGGGQLDEFWGGPWGHPFALAKWTALAWVTGAPVAVLSVGTASLEHRSTRLFCRFTLRRAVHASYRDEGSRLAMRKAGYRRDHPVVSDLAFATPRPSGRHVPPADAVRVAVGPMPYCDPKVWPAANAGIFQRYLRALASVGEALMARGWEVVLVSSDGPDRVTVEELAALIEQGTSGSPGLLSRPDTSTVEGFMAATSSCDAVVVSRLHGALLAMVAGTPVVALSYDRKVRALMEDMDQGGRCLEIEDFEPGEVVERVEEIVDAGGKGREALARSVRAARAPVENQYDRVSQLLDRTSRGQR